MSLLNPTPGEVIDRISIVELKIRAFERTGKDPYSFKDECAALEVYLAARGPWLPSIDKLSHELSEINKLLWCCEDEVRTSEKAVELSITAKRIARLNDERNRLIRAINSEYGLEPGEEKIYS